MASINLGSILQLAATVAVDIEIDTAELEAGQVVTLPIEPQVGTENGHPIYLAASLSETKQTAAPSPVAGT
jgi:hypothetical protein